MKHILENRKAYFRSLMVMYFAMMIGQLAFLLVVLYLQYKGGDYRAQNYEVVAYLNFFVPFFTVASIIMSPILYKWQLDMARKKTELEKKLAGYQVAFLLRMAALEGIVIFGIIGYMLTTNKLYFVYMGILYALQFMACPAVDKVMDALRLSIEERAQVVES